MTDGPTGRIAFIDRHRPALPSGDYVFSVHQDVVIAPRLRDLPGTQPTTASYTARSREVSVAGPRFSLDQQTVHAVFPPAGSLGEHSSVLPHISFSRSTLPWERFAPHHAEETVEERLSMPWLALLVFDQDEAPPKTRSTPDTVQERACTLATTPDGTGWTLVAKDAADTLSPIFPHEAGQSGGDPVAVIDVPHDFLRAVLPARADVALLAHVRQPTDADGRSAGPEVATVIANRLPRAGRASTVYLVSLEGSYNGKPIWEIPSGDAPIRLVTLHSWRFSCVDERHSFKGLLHHMNLEHVVKLESEMADRLPLFAVPHPVPAVLSSALDAVGHKPSDAATIATERETLIIIDPIAPMRLVLRRNGDGPYGLWRGETLLVEIAHNTDEGDFALLDTVLDVCPAPRPGIKATIVRTHASAWRLDDPNGGTLRLRATVAGIEVSRRLPHTLTLPLDGLNAARSHIATGHVALPHRMRNGDTSAAWYRGPLLPGPPAPQPPLAGPPPRSSDQLLRFEAETAMFDTAYAAAWELGRMMTLANTPVATALFNWKRRHRHAEDRHRAMIALEHLPLAGRVQTGDVCLPAPVARWFADLALLKGLPFSYLVPDPKMLPPESLRLFWLDPDWVHSLHDGAFSIGRVLATDRRRDAARLAALPPRYTRVTGVLIRSALVPGWPDLAVEAWDRAVPNENYEHDLLPPGTLRTEIRAAGDIIAAIDAGDARLVEDRFGIPDVGEITVAALIPGSRWQVNVNRNDTLYEIDRNGDRLSIARTSRLPLLRMDRLTPNILLCLFAGDLRTLDVHQKPEALHFGLNRDPAGGYTRELKSHRGGELPGVEAAISWGSEPHRVLDIGKLDTNIADTLGKLTAASITRLAKADVGPDPAAVEDWRTGFEASRTTPTSAQLALQLAEGVQKVRFVLWSAP